MLDFKQTTALYGGAFDPVHLGHLHVAREVLTAMPAIEQLAFVPANISPGKPALHASPEERLQFLELALQATPYKTWDYEVKKTGESFTVDTLREAHRLGALKQKLYWIMGADAYEGFDAWKKKDEIRALCRLIVVDRPGSEIRTKNQEDLVIHIPLHPLSSSAVRDALTQEKMPENALPPPLERHLANLLLQGKNPYAMH